MLTKPLKVTLTAGQAATFKVAVEQLVMLPASGDLTLPRMVLTEWYKRNAGKLVIIPDTLRLTFTPSQAYALNALMKSSPLLGDAHALAQGLIGVVDPKV